MINEYLLNFKTEIWRRTSFENKMNSLRELEKVIADQENRKISKIEIIPREILKNEKHPKSLMGYYKNSKIYINPNLITNESPYAAVETLAHESRHAYQEQVAINPDLENKTNLDRDVLVKNLNEGYLEYKDNSYDYALYRWQPIEKNAHEFGREFTDNLYLNTLNDTECDKYRRLKNNEMSDDKLLGEVYLGNKYEQVAHDEMVRKYNEKKVLEEDENKGHYLGI